MIRNLYVLEKVTPNEIIELEKKKADIVTFDYESHRQLVKHNIIHELPDNYLIAEIKSPKKFSYFIWVKTLIKNFEN